MDDADSFGTAAKIPLPAGRPLAMRRLAVRLLVVVLALVAVDIAVTAVYPAPDYDDDYRLPRALPTSRLAPLVSHLEERSGEGRQPVVAFVGASPTWGDAVTDRHETVPAAFRSVAEQGGVQARVYNLASRGQLLGDEYFIARRVADDADVVFVQLTYHAFNPVWRDGTTSRYPEIPSLLGVAVNESLAGLLGRAPSHSPDISGEVDRWLRAHWRLYGESDTIAGSMLGTTPENHLLERWQTLTQPDFAGDEEMTPSGHTFDELDPDQQMLALDEFSEAADFSIRANDSEVLLLERTAEELEGSGKQAVFYISPLNIGALESFDLFDRERYSSNTAPLRRIVEGHGHRFLDFNEGPPIPSSAFADINHTTAAGNALVAQQLWTRAADLVGVKP